MTWLESRSTIVFSSWRSDGQIGVVIDNKRYVYLTDSAYHPRWQKMAKYKPWTVLNEIKTLVKENRATLIYPKEPQKTQTTLF